MAYLDPGSGSYLSQIIIATILSAFIMIRVFWTRMTSIFGAKRQNSQSEQTQDDPGGVQSGDNED